MMPARTPDTSTTDQQLQAAADRIRHLSRTTSATVVETGQLLLEAKELTSHGSFAKWVQNTCGFTLRTAQTYMRVATLAEGKSETVSLLTLRSLYRLSAKRTPDQVIQWVVHEIGAGRIPTESEIEGKLRRSPGDIVSPAKQPAADQSARILAQELIERVGPSFAKSLLDGQWGLIGQQLQRELRLTSHGPKHHDRQPARLVHDPISNRYRPEAEAPAECSVQLGGTDHQDADGLVSAPESPPTAPADQADRTAPTVHRFEDGIPPFLRRTPNETHH